MSFISKWRYSTILPVSVNSRSGTHGPEPVVLGDRGLADGTLAVDLTDVVVSGALLGWFKPVAAASEQEQQDQSKCQSTGFDWCALYSRRKSILRHT